jgi:tetratricopeptide (TPR) repeat protein
MRLMRWGVGALAVSVACHALQPADDGPRAEATEPVLRHLAEIRNRAMAYAYYTRSAYLRHKVSHDLARTRADARSRQSIIEALVYLERALEFAPRATYLWWEYAALNNGLGRVNRVIYAYEHLAALTPSAALYSKLGALYELRDKSDLAVAQYRRALALEPDDLVLRERIVDVYVAEGLKSQQREDGELAQAQFARALEELDGVVQDTDKHWLRLKQGLLHELLEQHDAALAAYLRAAELDPDEPEGFVRASRIHYDRGENASREGDATGAARHFAAAAGLVTAAVSHTTHAPDLLNYSAYVLALAGEELDLAEELVQAALDYDAGNGAYVDTLGWVYFRKGELDRALAKVKRARELEGEDPVITEHLGDIYEQLGQPGRAREMWEQSLRLDAGNVNVRKKLNRLK